MNDKELQTIVEALRSMEARFEQPTTAAGPHLNSVDRATFKSQLMEAKFILDNELGRLNDFSFAILKATNLSGYGIFNPPSLDQLQEAVAAIEGGLNQVRRKQSGSNRAHGAIQKPAYVDPTRVLELQTSKSAWDMKRLVRLLQELNTAHERDLHMATAMLVRAVADHVAPIFGAKSFSEVANNYSASKSFSEQMKFLDTSLRKIADSHLHQQIRKAEVLPTASQVDFRGALDVLLSEIVRTIEQDLGRSE